MLDSIKVILLELLKDFGIFKRFGRFWDLSWLLRQLNLLLGRSYKFIVLSLSDQSVFNISLG